MHRACELKDQTYKKTRTLRFFVIILAALVSSVTESSPQGEAMDASLGHTPWGGGTLQQSSLSIFWTTPSKLSCTRLRVTPVALHVSRYTWSQLISWIL